MDTLKVKVTKTHIAKARRQSISRCPIALATDGMVGRCYVDVGNYRYRLPEIAIKFIEDFDSGKKCEPFEFEAEEV